MNLVTRFAVVLSLVTLGSSYVSAKVAAVTLTKLDGPLYLVEDNNFAKTNSLVYIGTSSIPDRRTSHVVQRKSMKPESASRTAFAVAKWRAGHQILDGGSIFSDPYAFAVLGEQPEAIAAELAKDPDNSKARLYVATRSRIGEDWLDASYSRGVRQIAVLGAGFDTFGLRNPYHDLKVYEVDHPATQNWKRKKLAAANLALPQTLNFVPADFSAGDLSETLAGSGFDVTAATFFLWLGVVPYLSQNDVFKTLTFIASVPDSEVVFDYSEPIENYPVDEQPYIEAINKKVASLGEPWLSHFDPDCLADHLRKMGFNEIEDLDRNAFVNRFAQAESTQPRVTGPHLLRARC